MQDESRDVLAPQEHWDQGFEHLELFIAPPEDPIRIWLEANLPSGEGACLELGCFPGRYLAVLGAMGYEVNGVDLTPRVATDLPPWLRRHGYRVGDIVRADLFSHVFRRRYEVVTSFGLIEHFKDWADLLSRQAGLVQPGGYLVVATPNFRGAVQQWLHRRLDSVNLGLHNLEAMAPAAWSEIVRTQGFEVRYAGYFGRFDFWVGPQERTLGQRILLRIINKLLRVLRKVPEGYAAMAPYCGLIARKSGAADPPAARR